MITFILLWILLSVLIGQLGHNRRIGYLNTFLTCLILSPLVGLAAALTSRFNEDIDRDKEILNTLKSIENNLSK